MSSSLLARKRVAVFPAARYDQERHLLTSIAELYPVTFVLGSETGTEHLSAAIFFPEAWDISESLFQRGISSFRFARRDRVIAVAGDDDVTFSRNEILHPAFCGATERLDRAISVAQGIAADGHLALASHSSGPLWQFREASGAELHTSAFAPPELGDGELLWSQLEFAKWEGLFPLMHFLRRLTADVDWQPAAPAGCLMFDDPNLHAQRYGHLDFAELVRDSELHNYHVAFATVPIDAWYAASKAVALFRNNRKRLSLLVHGNNHIKDELAREYGKEDGLSLLAQALTRVAGFERRTGLKVEKVIAPPHGGCSYSILSQMLRLPFEGVCTMASSLVLSPSGPLPADFGVSPTWFMAGGVPVVGRWDLRYGMIPLRLAAFLGQPVVPYGHHQDCAAGIDRLSRVAAEVNRWEPRTWADMESIMRLQYRTRTDGELLHIEMRSRRVSVQIPIGVTHLAIHAPAGVDLNMGIRISSADNLDEACHWGIPVPVRKPGLIELGMIRDSVVDPMEVPSPGFQPWAPIRRCLSIARDRMTSAVRAPAACN